MLYCYDAQQEDGNKVKRAAVLYQASVKVDDANPNHPVPLAQNLLYRARRRSGHHGTYRAQLGDTILQVPPCATSGRGWPGGWPVQAQLLQRPHA